VVTDLADRYGTATGPGRRALVAGVVVLAGVGLSWLVWVMLAHGRPLVQSELNGFETVDQHTVSARFTVVRSDEDVEASCLLRAFAADHAVVGELDVTVGPGAPATRTLEREVRTERGATSVEVVGCLAEGQSRRR
jgi:Domain of unknown function (DUF4307)